MIRHAGRAADSCPPVPAFVFRVSCLRPLAVSVLARQCVFTRRSGHLQSLSACGQGLSAAPGGALFSLAAGMKAGIGA